MSKQLAKNTVIFSSMTLLSRVLGFVRDMVIAYIFGVSGAADAFWVAFKIPNFMRRLFAEGAFSQAFVPVLSEYKETQDHEQVRQFISRMMGTLGSALLLLTILVELGTPVVIAVFAPGYLHNPAQFALASHMLHLTFPYLLFISLTAFAGAVLNTYGRFAVPAFTPVLLNLSLIAAAFGLSSHFHQPVVALAWGVFVAGVVQLIFQIPFLRYRGLLVLPRMRWRDPGVRRVLKLMLPAIFGVSVVQVNLLLDTVFASFLPAGSISWLYYSDRLTSFPLGVFGVAIATVILPTLAKAFSKNSHEDYNASINWAIRSVLLIALPAGIAIFILSAPLLSTLFQHGKFSAEDVMMAQRSLLMFALGVPGFMLIKVLASGFYARQNIKTPVRYAVVAMICNSVLNLILIFPMAHAGLALATTASSTLNAGLLFFGLLKREIYVPSPGWRRYILQMLVANVVMGALVWFFKPPTQEWLSAGLSWRIQHLIPLIGLGAASYFAVLWLMGMRPRDFIHTTKHPARESNTL